MNFTRLHYSLAIMAATFLLGGVTIAQQRRSTILGFEFVTKNCPASNDIVLVPIDPAK